MGQVSLQVSLQGIRKRCGDVQAIKAIDLAVCDGALPIVVGRGGCGKRSTLRMSAGLEGITAGGPRVSELPLRYPKALPGGRCVAAGRPPDAAWAPAFGAKHQLAA